MAAPKIIPYDVELRSVNPVRSFDRPKAYTNDLNSVEFQFKVLDMTSTELTTATAVTLVYMRDGSFFANPSTDVSRVGNVFSYLLKENEGNHAGVAQIQLVVTVDGMELASQLFDFEIINGLETKVAQEVMIYDWTTLTRDARAYIDQFVADEVFRDAQFENAQFDRNITFVETQNQRAADFTAAQDSRTATFNASEVSRTQTFTASEATREQEFDLAEAGRAAGYTADHNRAETDHTIAVDDSEQAATDHTTAVNDHTIADTDHTRAEADHTRADADSATVAGFNTRLTAEETATANNKISAVKSKTFADVDARLEDVEFDTTLMGTNLVTNGDFSNGATEWVSINASPTVNSGILSFTSTANPGGVRYDVTNFQSAKGHKLYVFASFKANNSNVKLFVNDGVDQTFVNHSGDNLMRGYSIIRTISPLAIQASIRVYDTNVSGWSEVQVSKVLAIDLTFAFGAGNEPTLEQMDGIMAKFTNSWFNGTANLFRANATLNKLMAVDARTEFEAKNEVVNGDFSNGVTGWNFNQSTASVLNNECTVTGDGSITSFGIYQNTNGTFNTGDIIYYRERFKATGSQPTSFQLRARSSLGAPSAVIKTISSPTLGTWYDVSERYTMLSTNTGTIQATSTINYADAASQALGSIVFKSIVAINLTKAFGAGKEPTLAEMDRLMARFPNGWFDGVKPIQTIETLYQEKANKVQEAWITPTLINGVTEVSGYPVRYMKDEMGFVHLKGRIRVSSIGLLFATLPIGYRSTNELNFAAITALNVISRIVLAASGNLNVYGNTGDISLDGITFKAEA